MDGHLLHAYSIYIGLHVTSVNPCNRCPSISTNAGLSKYGAYNRSYLVISIYTCYIFRHDIDIYGKGKYFVDFT